MRKNISKDFTKVIKNYVDMAKDLCYDESVIEKLKNAKSDVELENIMIGARKRWD